MAPVFLGSHLSEKLVQEGHNVICLDNFYTGHRKNVEHLLDYPNFEIVRHDVTFPLLTDNWALVSNGSRTSSLEILSQKSNLTPFAVVGPSATLRPKPSPDMFSYLLTKERLSHDTVLVLEDSVTGGEAAKLARLSYKIVSHLC